MKKENKRFLYLDLLKVFAAIFVIFNHYSYVIDKNSFVFNFFTTVFFVVCKTAVPIFIMVTGALILSKKISYKEIFAKRIFRVVIPLIVVSFIYFFLVINDFSFNNLLKFVLSMFTNYNGDYIPYWLWYLYALIALYIMSPFLQKMLDNFTNKDYKYFFLFFIVGLGIINFVLSLLMIFFNLYINFNSGIVSNIFSNTVGLYVFGFYIFRNKISVRMKNISWVVLFSSFIIGVILTFYAVYFKNFSYDNVATWWNLFVILLACSLFVLFKYYFDDFKFNSFLKKVIVICSNSSFGVYLIHPFL